MAIQYLDKALSIRKILLGENSIDVSTSLWNIALAYEIMEEYSKSNEFYELSLKIITSQLGE